MVSLIGGCLLSNAQELNGWTVEPSFKPDFVDLSPNGRYLIAENESRYAVWDTESKTEVLSGKYRNKLGRNFRDVYLTEGSAYLLFENENIFLQVDYTLTFTKVDAFDLTTGNKIWSLDNLDIGLNAVEAIYQLMTNTQRFVQNEEQLGNATFTAATGIGTTSKNNTNPAYFVGHDETIRKQINYLPERNAIVVNGKESLQLLDIKTGKILWEQPELKGPMGEVFYHAPSDMLIAVRISNKGLGEIGDIQHMLSRPEVQALDTNTGDLRWNLKYNGDFIPGIAYVADETLVLPYFGLMLVDINTGEERDGDVKSGMERQRAMQRRMSVLGSAGLGDNCSYPILDENDVLHYFVGYSKGKDINPDGGRKAYLQIDIHQDKIILAEEGLARQGNRVIQEELTDDLLYVKLTKGLSSTYILALDRNTGKTVFETKAVKNRLGTDYDPFLLNRSRIVDLSSKGIHIYDTNTGEDIETISHKDLGVGRLRNQIIFDKGLILSGTTGIAITDDQGLVRLVVNDSGKLRDCRIGDDEIWFLTDDKMRRVSINTMAVIDEMSIDKGEKVFFDSTGTHIVKVDTGGKKIMISR